MTREDFILINKHLTHEQLSNILYDTITKYEANDKARSIVAMLFWRARKDKRLADEENKFFTYDIALHYFIIFRQAHKMLKDNL